MFERFTERARQVIGLAQDEARRLQHGYIGTEHLLLGLLREENGLAARVLASLGVGAEDVRSHVRRIVGEGDHVESGEIPLTPRAEKVLELALREATRMGHSFIGTEHILLGLDTEGEGVANRILDGLGATSERIRGELAGAFGALPPREESGRRRASISLGDERRRSIALAVGGGAVLFAAGLLVGWVIWG